MKKITFLIAAFTMSFGFAQNNIDNNSIQAQLASEIPPVRTCATMEENDAQAIANFQDALAPHVAAYLKSVGDGGAPESAYTIPTIVHVIHNSGENVGFNSNIAAARVTEQITILNDDLKRQNADAGNTPSYFAAVAADFEISFCLINRYPSGHALAGQVMPEKGIHRVDATTIPGLGNAPGGGYLRANVNNLIKFYHNWNQDEVFNIWVVRLETGLLGYATFPNTTAAYLDGVVVGYQYFGNTFAAPYNKGRTATHEVGHWLGLFHIWGDDNGACSGSDLVADTPNQADNSGGCPSGVQTDACVGGTGYMYQNYMDYTNDACSNVFTAGQKARAQSVMATQPRRLNLNQYASSLCAPTGVDQVLDEHNINVYPNPTKDVINVVFPSVMNTEVVVHNMIGEVVFESDNSIKSRKLLIDMSLHPNGAYFVKVKTNDKVITKKIVLVK